MSLFYDKELDLAFAKSNSITKQLSYDSLTPILAYAALGGVGTTLMESAYDEGYGKYSYLGFNQLATLRAGDNQVNIEYADNLVIHYGIDPYILLEDFCAKRKAFGLLSYDLVRLKEHLPDRHPTNAMPDLFVRLYKTVLCFDHQAQQLVITHEGSSAELEQILVKLANNVTIPTIAKQEQVELKPDISDAEFIGKILRAKEYIRQGDIFQVVLSRTFSAYVDISPFALYRALRKLNPTPYLYLFVEPEFSVIGASPELLVGVKNGVIETVPIAGTCKSDDDINLLLADEKENAEHIMLLDLARNDIGAVSRCGSVCVTKFKNVKTYSHVRHIVSHVVGQLDARYNPFAVIKSVLPAGTLSGAPKIRAMEIIDELEVSRRGLYGGAVLFVDDDGSLTSAIAIRTMVMRQQQLELRTGAGIVYDSVPEKEVAETYLKAKGALSSIELALRGGL